MSKLVRVAVDAMGGDHAPQAIVRGAVDALQMRNDLFIFLAGRDRAGEIHVSGRTGADRTGHGGY